MELWGNKVIFIFLLLAGASRSQNIGQPCPRLDDTLGVCRDIKECINQNGNIESASTLKLCSSSTLRKVIACCRKTPHTIAKEKCQLWKRQAAAADPTCTITIPLVTGGNVAGVGQFPHMVSLLESNPIGPPIHRCGGILIAETYVLTAAHCFDENPKLFARIGGHDHGVDEPDWTFDVGIADTILHPEYNLPRKYNDIALLQLKSPVPFTKRIRPACLPYGINRIEAGTKMVIAGWGHFKQGRDPTPPILRRADVKVMDRFECDRSSITGGFVGPLKYPVGITDSIICVDESEGSSCTGDSGGPMMLPAEHCDIKEVVGLVSQGVAGCSLTKTPGVYTRIDYYLDWIIENVWSDELFKKK